MSRLYSTLVSITGDRGDKPRLSLSLMACVMDGSFNAPLSEQATSYGIQNITVIVRVPDLCGGLPKEEDVVELPDRRKFKVEHVEPFYGREWVLDCREIE